MALSVGLSEDAFSALEGKLRRFMEEDIYPNEMVFDEQSRAIGATNEWYDPPILTALKVRAVAVRRPARRRVPRADRRAFQPRSLPHAPPIPMTFAPPSPRRRLPAAARPWR